MLGSASELGSGVLGAFIKFIGRTVCLHDSPNGAVHSGILLILMSVLYKNREKHVVTLLACSLTVRPSKAEAEKMQKINEKQHEATVEEP